ncbi:sensor histidine kinase [Streptomyces sp. WAC05374]|uniref:sensor histidine kinase n=1 Tax=Streptomyces sp. WAC05374 TaxID=2487420 RepID=UPI000F877515|nr:sensor histidine kinase [Streptomyces sp. WAC05374]RST12192.1 sensor histidine kinase [Streptomyces sp. WAC05374]TDF44301.1 sensor histidine kinase [Streptomyces sp. WAC05374]TDF53769.1 sensor histidine kinase [Streptomyces sp. WAC05374]TDF58602.1 sensor histidine kinase [Streptomyces sp. WAC05374]
MDPRTPWQALTRGDYLRGGWPWRSAGYLASGVLVGVAVLAVLLVLAAFSLLLVGVPLLLLAGVALGGAERWRLRLVDAEPAADPHRTPDEPGLAAWLRVRVREQATWRELAYALLLGCVLWPLEGLALAVALGAPLALMTTPVQLALDGQEVRVLKGPLVTTYPVACAAALAGLALLPALLYPLGALAGARAALTRLLLAPRDTELRRRIGEVTRSRARLVAAFEAERRRIERDLHDGAQQRLVALTMTLGLARLDAPPGPLADQLAKAHDEAGRVLTELRELIHGIHPQVLADYGLGAALTDAADRSAVPVATDLDLPRLPPPVESAAYFAVCEALTNIGRHSGATRARLTARHGGELLRMEVEDDGTGGADASRGTGLTGLADRIAVLDGRLAIISPKGGPTVLRVEIPCQALCG